VNRTRGFVNLNRFKSGRAIKQLTKITDDMDRIRVQGRKREDKK